MSQLHATLQFAYSPAAKLDARDTGHGFIRARGFFVYPERDRTEGRGVGRRTCYAVAPSISINLERGCRSAPRIAGLRLSSFSGRQHDWSMLSTVSAVDALATIRDRDLSASRVNRAKAGYAGSIPARSIFNVLAGGRI